MRLLHLNIIIRCDIVTLQLEPMVHILCIPNKTACHITLSNKMGLQGPYSCNKASMAHKMCNKF